MEVKDLRRHCTPGLRSAPKLFSSLADALEWILMDNGVTFSLHYLDDFLTAGRANTGQCEANLQKIYDICRRLGVPLKMEKIEDPTTILTFLGIELDTTKLELCLPKGKLEGLKQEIKAWKRRCSCRKRALLSLIGKLSHACKVVIAGRLFLRRMIETSKKARRLNH